MGITGLLPFLEKASTKGNISQFAGGTVAIDTYCWLHKGAFSCAEKLALGQPTDAYVTYCMRFVNMLLGNNIKPILVFDGCHLPAKKDTESKRRELRDKNRKKAAELIRLGQVADGKNLLRRSIDISHEMALNLIKACHERNIDCIVAPYEADSQLAYLNISGIADVIITEDSDLTLFGCKKIFFKMDVAGNGVLVEQDRFHLAMGVRSEHFSMDKFRYMCILSGCDYLPSLPGIGLVKACKFINKTAETDMHKALTRLSSYLNMKSLDVSIEYRDAFLRADVTFKHQLVFCPFKRKQVRLTPPTTDVTPEQLHYAGKEMPDDLAWQLAIGNYDPMSLKKIHDYDPDTYASGKSITRTNSWKAAPVVKHDSIWNTDFKINKKPPKEDKQTTLWPDTFGKVTILKTSDIARPLTSPKRSYEEVNEMEQEEMIKLYTRNKSESNKRSCSDVDVSNLQLDTSGLEEREKSPILVRRANPFAKTTKSLEISPSLLDKGKNRSKFRNLARFRPTVVDNNILTESKFFAQTTDLPKLPNFKNCATANYPATEKCYGLYQSADSKAHTAEALEYDNYLLSRTDDQQLECKELDIKNERRIPAVEDRMETSQNHAVIQELCISESTYEETVTEMHGALPVAEEESTSGVNSLDIVYTDRDIILPVNTRNSSIANGLKDLQPNYTKPNLLQWKNTKVNSSTALLSIGVLNSQNNGTLRAMQGAAKTNRLPRTRSVNKKFQPVKRKSQVEQGQQCLLSSFGFQKKTGLQH
ncbi:exonuclease 1 isoform X1 [Neodiprion pinetum]|uniref:exonuclease 1 isoform X1 n=2 Tax=Neodiprion pinetum TaxID=441929 RepID=UPI001EDEA69D|nr:exonuclease 1 isoform X1 [Neodiprion pinetum]XP_046476914.1 exonuclease 1 isoform X1 [Neodiprion pinetum]